MSLIFKDILDAAKHREREHTVLFLTRTAAERKRQIQRLVDEAHAMGLAPFVSHLNQTVAIAGCTAVFRVAYSRIHDELRGRIFTDIQGLDALHGLDNADGIKRELAHRVR